MPSSMGSGEALAEEKLIDKPASLESLQSLAGDDVLAANLWLVQAVIQSSTSPALDDSFLNKFQTVQPQKPTKSTSLESLAWISKEPSAGIKLPDKIQCPLERQFALSQILLAFDIDHGSNNTLVNELEDLALPENLPISEGNTARLMLTNSLHSVLSNIQEISKRQRWSSEMTKSLQDESMLERLERLLMAAYPDRCERDPGFVEAILTTAVEESREKELVAKLTLLLQSSSSNQEQNCSKSSLGNLKGNSDSLPESSFVSMAMIQMQLSTVEHTLMNPTLPNSDTRLKNSLLKATSEGLLGLLSAAPLGGLAQIAEWEHSALDTIAARLKHLGEASEFHDDVTQLLVALGIQRRSLRATLSALFQVLGNEHQGEEAIEISSKLQSIVSRLGRVRLFCQLNPKVLLGDDAVIVRNVHVQSGGFAENFVDVTSAEVKNTTLDELTKARPQVGDFVRVAAPCWSCAVLKSGEVGRIVVDDGGRSPFRIVGPRGYSERWFNNESLLRLSEEEVKEMKLGSSEDMSSTHNFMDLDLKFTPPARPGRQEAAESIAVSPDGRYMYICGNSVAGLVKVGLGNATLHGSPTIEGHVYASRSISMRRCISQTTQQSATKSLCFVAAVKDKVFLFSRKAGSLHLHVDALCSSTMKRIAPHRDVHKVLFFPEILEEQVSTVNFPRKDAIIKALPSRRGVFIERSQQAGENLSHPLTVAWHGVNATWLHGTGSWYFEVCIVRPGKISMGWATSPFFERGVAMKESSWLFHAHSTEATDDKGSSASFGRICKAGDIIGCALSFDKNAGRGMISYSLNGDWSSPMGSAFTLDCKTLSVRPIVVLGTIDGASKEKETPPSDIPSSASHHEMENVPHDEDTRNTSPAIEFYFGVKYVHGKEVEAGSLFSFDAPSLEYRSIYSTVGQEGETQERSDELHYDHLAPLPPMACDGRFVYITQRASSLLPPLQLSGEDNFSPAQASEDLIVDKLDPLDDFKLVQRRRIAYQEQEGLPPVEHFLDWKCFADGSSVVVLHDEEVVNQTWDKTHRLRVGILSDDNADEKGTCWKLHDVNTGAVKQLGNGLSVCEVQESSAGLNWDALAFCGTHSVIWSWSSIHNALEMRTVEGALPSSAGLLIESNTFEMSERPCRAEFVAKCLHDVARISRSFASSSIPTGNIFLETLKQMLGIGTFPSKQTGAFLDSHPEVIDMLASLSLVFRGSSVHPTFKEQGLRACFQLLHVNTCPSLAHQVKTETRQTILKLCEQVIESSEDSEALKQQCVDYLIVAAPLLFPTLEGLVSFAIRQVRQGLSSERAYTHQVCSGILHIIAAHLLGLPTSKQLQVTEELLPALIDAAHILTTRQCKDLANCDFVVKSDGEVADHHSVTFCEAAVSVVNVILAIGLEAPRRNGSDVGDAVFHKVVDIFMLVCDRCSKVLRVAIESAAQIRSSFETSSDTTKRIVALGGAIRRSLVGRAFVSSCSRLEFLLRSKEDKEHAISVLLATNFSLANLTALLAQTMSFCSILSQTDAPGTQDHEEAKTVPRRRSSTLANAAAEIAAQYNPTSGSNHSLSYSWSKSTTIVKDIDSKHSYENDTMIMQLVEVPGADFVTIRFDPRTSTEPERDFLRFLRVAPDVEPEDYFPEEAPEESRYGEERYSGHTGWPGVGNTPPLVIPSNRFIVTFCSDGSDVDWGFKFQVEARVSETRTVVCKPWYAHLAALCRDFVFAVIHGTVGSAGALSEMETKQLRWVQNPILSGGLKCVSEEVVRHLQNSVSVPSHVTEFPTKTSNGLPPLPQQQLGQAPSSVSQASTFNSSRTIHTRARSGSHARTLSMSDDDRAASEQLLLDMVSDAFPPPGLGGVLFKVLREQRVALDQGFFTHRAAASLYAALVRVNGLEREALKLARSYFNRDNESSSATREAPSPRLLKVWGYAQYIRSWADQLVVNGQVQHHVEASLPTEHVLRKKLLEILANKQKYDDPEEPQYAVLCEIVAERARFLIKDVAPPVSRMVTLRSFRQDAARARWHRLRRFYCPKTQLLIRDQKRWELAISAIRAMSALHTVYTGKGDSKSEVHTKQRLSESKTFDASSERDTRERSLSKDSMDEAAHKSWRQRPPVLRLTRSNSLTNGLDSPFALTPPHVLSTKSTTSSGSGQSTTAHFNFHGNVHRRRERVSGGLRRSSVVESEGDVDIQLQEHDKSLSESVNIFMQSPVPIDAETLRRVLEIRNKRAATRSAGFSFINAFMSMARKENRHREGRLLFDVVLQATSRALRGFDSGHNFARSTGRRIAASLGNEDIPHLDTVTTAMTRALQFDEGQRDSSDSSSLEGKADELDASQDDSSALEAHYLTDLQGCSANLQDAVSEKYLFFLDAVASFMKLSIRRVESVSRSLEKNKSEWDGFEDYESSLVALSGHLLEQLQQFLRVVSLDYVENDLEILAKSGIVPVLSSILIKFPQAQPRGLASGLKSMAWKTFELLLRRCVCESGRGSDKLTSGNSVQQELLDVLVSMLETLLDGGAARAADSPQTTRNTLGQEAVIVSQTDSPVRLNGSETVSLVSNLCTPPVSCSLRAVVCLSQDNFSPGRLFSFGNPRSSVNSVAQILTSPPSMESSAQFAWIEVAIDDQQRIVFHAGDLAGVQVSVTSEYSLPFDTICEVGFTIVEAQTLEVHILSTFPATKDQPSKRVYTIEVFDGVLHELGQVLPGLQAKNAIQIDTSCIGSIVRVVHGPLSGHVGVLVGLRDTTGCVVVDVADQSESYGKLAILLNSTQFVSTCEDATSIFPACPIEASKALEKETEDGTPIDRQLANTMYNAGFTKKEVALALETLFSKESRQPKSFRYVASSLLSTPAFVGQCPEWGGRYGRKCASGVTLEALSQGSLGTKNFDNSGLIEPEVSHRVLSDLCNPSNPRGGFSLRMPISSFMGDSFKGLWDSNNQPDVVAGEDKASSEAEEKDRTSGEDNESATVRALRVLSLTFAVCSSSVGRARLIAPFPLSLLIRTCVESSAPLELRIASAKVLSAVVQNVSPNMVTRCARNVIASLKLQRTLHVEGFEEDDDFLKLLMHTIGAAIYPVRTNELLSQSAATTGAIAFQLIELLHNLCRSELWADRVSRYIYRGLTEVVDEAECINQGIRKCLEGRTIQGAVSSLALLGGAYEAPWVGGRAFTSNTEGLLAKNEVIVVGRVPPLEEPKQFEWSQGSKLPFREKPLDVTAACSVEASSEQLSAPAQAVLNESPSYWESNGYTPHWIQVRVPESIRIHTVSILTNEAFQNYSPQNIDVWLGSATESLRKVASISLPLVTRRTRLVDDSEVQSTDRIIKLELNSNHAGGCDSRIQNIRVSGVRETQAQDLSGLSSAGEMYYIRPVYGNENETELKSDPANLREVDASVLAPLRLIPPIELLEALDKNVVKALQRLLRREATTLAEIDIKARASKVMCVLLESPTLMKTVGAALVPQLLSESRARTLGPPMVKTTPKWALDQRLAQKLRLVLPSEDELSNPLDSVSVTFAPAGKTHRSLALDTPPMISGRHCWEITLLQDTLDDETALMGITSRRDLNQALENQPSNLLEPSSEMWLLQCYNGARLHKGVGSQWDCARSMKVHPGDTVRFLLDMSIGSLLVGINNAPMIQVFFGIHKEAIWGVYPCVASYGNHANVRFGVQNIRMTHFGSQLVPQRHLLLNGSGSDMEARAAKLVSLLADGLASTGTLYKSTDNIALTPGGSEETSHDRSDYWSRLVLQVKHNREKEYARDDDDSVTSDFTRDVETPSTLSKHRRKSTLEQLSHMSLEKDQQGSKPAGSTLDASRQMIQKMNALYELSETSVESDAHGNKDIVGLSRRNLEAQQIVMDLLSDVRFIGNAEWLSAASMEVFRGLYMRYSERALEQLVVDWSANTQLPLPACLVQPGALDKTVNLIFKSCGGEEVASRAIDAIHALCKNDEGMTSTLLDLSLDVFQTIGRELANAVKEYHQVLSLLDEEREREQRESATARAQIEAAQSSSKLESSRSSATTRTSTRRRVTEMMEPNADGSRGRLRVGDRVRARFMGGQRWYTGRIAEVFPDDTYSVHYDDGDKEKRVPRHVIVGQFDHARDEGLKATRRSSRVEPRPSIPGISTPKFSIGEPVQARARRGVTWNSGHIVKVHETGVYDIHYLDGRNETSVKPQYIRPASPSVAPNGGTGASPTRFMEAIRRRVAVPRRPQNLEEVPSDSLPSAPALVEDESVHGYGQVAEPLTGNETFMLIADRYRGDIPASGKPDSAQVSIINSPAAADGFVRSVRLRLAEPPAEDASTWDLHVFERAGDTSTFFVVSSTPSHPTHAQIHFDPNSTDIQTVPVVGRLCIDQGQYLGVINPHGRLNVAYTPGKKKLEESWAFKPVEVFYLMPKNVPMPFEGGPHRTRLWHGRAGWCATMVVANSSSSGETPRLLKQAAEKVFSAALPSGLQVDEAFRQACWLIRILVRDGFLGGLDILSVENLIRSFRRICEHGIFLLDGDVTDPEETSSVLFESWPPLVELLAQLCASVTEDTMRLIADGEELPAPLPRNETEELIRLQSVLEFKVNDMNAKRAKRLRDAFKSKAAKTKDRGGRARSSSISSRGELEVALEHLNDGLALQSSGSRVASEGTGDGDPKNNNVGQNAAKTVSYVETSSSLTEGSENNMNGLRFQRLLKCLVAVDDLTCKDGLDGEPLIVDSPRRSFNELTEWREFDVSLEEQALGTEAPIKYELFQGKVCVSATRQVAKSIPASDNVAVSNARTVASSLAIGDELVAVDGVNLKAMSPEERKTMVERAVACFCRVENEGGLSSLVKITSPLKVNGVLLPPPQDEGLRRTSSRLGGDRLSIAPLSSGEKKHTLTFRRRQSCKTFAQQLESGKCVSYRGVQANKELGDSSGSGSAEWLDPLVTATELLKSFACRSLPPVRFLKEMFVNWSQLKHRTVLESVHPVFGSTEPLVSKQVHNRPPYSGSRRRTHSRDGGPSGGTDLLTQMNSGSSALGGSLKTSEGSTSALQMATIPGATAIRLSWDSRTCLHRGSNESSITVIGGECKLQGIGGSPPNITVVSGSTVSVDVRNANAPKGSHPELGGRITVAGLQNRAGAYVWLGTKLGYRAKFYCGRAGRVVAGWSDSHGACGPFGDQQCPDCSAFQPKNIDGVPMRPGISWEMKENTRFCDMLYCDMCEPGNVIPCAKCRHVLFILSHTKSLTKVPYQKRMDFENVTDYERYLNCVMVPGMPFRVTRSINEETLSRPMRYSIEPGTVGTLLYVRHGHAYFKPLRTNHTTPLAVLLRDLELMTVQEAGGTDLRFEVGPGRTATHRDQLFASIGNKTDSSDGTPSESFPADAPVRFLEFENFSSPVEYNNYMSRTCRKGHKVRCSKSYESVSAGDVGIVIEIDEGDELPCKVQWENLGALYWLPWESLSLNLTPLNDNFGGSGSDFQADETDGPHSSRAKEPEIASKDEVRVTFSSQYKHSTIELYNMNRSVTRGVNSSYGWATQCTNQPVDDIVGKMNVQFRLLTALNSRLYVGVIAGSGRVEQDDQVDRLPMSLPTGSTSPSSAGDATDRRVGCWALGLDGSLLVNGIKVREKTPSKAWSAGDVLTVSVDMSSRSVTFIRGTTVLDTISDLPQQVVHAVSLRSSCQHISIVKAEVGELATPYPIEGWGYRVVVEPIFDAARLSVESSSDDPLEKEFWAYLQRQRSWSQRSDEALVTFVNETVEGRGLDLSRLFNLGWSDLVALSPLALVAADEPPSEEGDGKPKELQVMQTLETSAAMATLIRTRASELPVDRSSCIKVGDDTTISERQLDLILDDAAQRFDLIRALNSSVFDALGLLDLTACKDPSSSAAYLSECCGLIFDKFKLPLWSDAISSTKAEDIHKFDVVLDFGRAMSRRHIADIHGRHSVFAQAFRVMHPMPPKTLRAHGKLYKCVMRGMASHDDGGPYRQSFSEYCTELQSLPGVGLLLPCSNRANQIRINRDRWLPNPAATSPVQTSMYEFLGKLMGIAIRNNELLDLRLPSLVWKPLVNQSPTLADLRAVDVLTVTSCDPNSTDPAELLTSQELFFTVNTLDGREEELVPGGESLRVTLENYDEWARRTIEYKIHEFDTQIEAIRRGLATIVPQRLLMLFRWDELELMVCGRPKLDLELLKRMTVYSDCSESDAHIHHFWQVLEEFTEEQRSGYIKFVWGRSRLPQDKTSWEQPHKIAAFHAPRPTYGAAPTPEDSLLPFAHTCYFTIDLPRYSSVEATRRKLLFAIEHCIEIDGDQTTTGRRAAAMGFEIGDSDDEGEDITPAEGEVAAGSVSPGSPGADQDNLPASPPPPPPANAVFEEAMSSPHLSLDTIMEQTNPLRGLIASRNTDAPSPDAQDPFREFSGADHRVPWSISRREHH